MTLFKPSNDCYSIQIVGHYFVKTWSRMSKFNRMLKTKLRFWRNFYNMKVLPHGVWCEWVIEVRNEWRYIGKKKTYECDMHATVVFKRSTVCITVSENQLCDPKMTKQIRERWREVWHSGPWRRGEEQEKIYNWSRMMEAASTSPKTSQSESEREQCSQNTLENGSETMKRAEKT